MSDLAVNDGQKCSEPDSSLCLCVFVRVCVYVSEQAHLSQRIIVPGDLGVRVDVLQVPAEGFTLKLLP